MICGNFAITQAPMSTSGMIVNPTTEDMIDATKEALDNMGMTMVDGTVGPTQMASGQGCNPDMVSDCGRRHCTKKVDKQLCEIKSSTYYRGTVVGHYMTDTQPNDSGEQKFVTTQYCGTNADCIARFYEKFPPINGTQVAYYHPNDPTELRFSNAPNGGWIGATIGSGVLLAVSVTGLVVVIVMQAKNNQDPEAANSTTMTSSSSRRTGSARRGAARSRINGDPVSTRRVSNRRG